MVREAEDYRDDLSQDRITAIQYYDGVMTDTPEVPLPAAVWAMGLGLAGLGGAIRRKAKAA